MKFSKFTSLAALLLTVLVARADEAPLPDIPYKQFTLKNGLTLIVHEDHKAPIVAVNIWYHVGSKNEKKGKTGFAHLFEHLMFNGSEHFNDDYFKATEKVGATDLNGTTNQDRTNFFENVPKGALDYILWLESDRMGHLIGAVDQAKLDEQRGVVQNEKRQDENEPYAISEELIQHNTYPSGHPYSWTVIGSMEDLNAASLDDVKEWFRTYYGAANATIVVAGDVATDEALAKVEKYFGDIPSGPPVARHSSYVAKMSGTHRMKAQDRVPQARLYKIWNTPQLGTLDDTYLTLAASVLADGKTSRLYKRLVFDEQLATSVQAYNDTNEIAGQFRIVVDAKPGVELSSIEKIVDEELAKLLASGPTSEELTRVKVRFESGFVRGIERIGGFGGKSDILASCYTYLGDASAYKKELANFRAASVAQVMDYARKWLSDGQFVLEITPFPEYGTTKSEVDRSKLVVPDLKADAVFPRFERATLSNGLKIILAERHSVPVVDFRLLLDAGYSSDTPATAGRASFAFDMLDEGTSSRNALQISNDVDSIGARLSTGCNLDLGNISLNTLKTQLDKGLEIYADVILHPAFSDADFKRLQKQRLAGIQREKADPTKLALRIMPGLLFGNEHPYGRPFTGSGYESTVSKLSPTELRKFYETWVRPNNATLVIVGDTTLAEITPKLEKLLGSWKPATVPTLSIPEVKPAAAQTIYLLDRPGAQQSVVFAGEVTLPKANPDEIAIEVMNEILGGSFTSRVNMNLREDKHWSYGASAFAVNAKAQRPYLCIAPVQSDKTKEAVQEIQREFTQYIGDKPATEAELAKSARDLSLGLAGNWETLSAVSGSISDIVRFGLPDDYYQTYASKIQALNLEQIRKVAPLVVHPSRTTWVIVGDRAKIEKGLRELNLGELKLLDADGGLMK